MMPLWSGEYCNKQTAGGFWAPYYRVLEVEERRHVLLKGEDISYLGEETWRRHVLVAFIKWKNGADRQIDTPADRQIDYPWQKVSRDTFLRTKLVLY
jgi:hypothetical protein